MLTYDRFIAMVERNEHLPDPYDYKTIMDHIEWELYSAKTSPIPIACDSKRILNYVYKHIQITCENHGWFCSRGLFGLWLTKFRWYHKISLIHWILS